MTAGSLLSLGAVLVLAPALPGIATKTKSLLTGRRGAPVLQLYSDLVRLLRKGAVYSTTTTWVFRRPVAGVVTPLLAGLLLPLDGRAALLRSRATSSRSPACWRWAASLSILAALDTGSSFEGMGASREVAFASLAEPALFLCFVVLMLATGQLSLERHARRAAPAPLPRAGRGESVHRAPRRELAASRSTIPPRTSS